ncbi:MAG: enoyl-CoA hydratase/isomerase family protein [Bacteroidetes bacterium]|nr:enoyl-CoA hydratase/isomerase family protein [Bacteroidota bacterium]
MALVEYESRDRIAFITMNRPEKRNALSPVLVSDLKKLFQKAAEDPQVRAIILRAAGEAFCAGADLAYLEKLKDFTFEENLSDSQHLKELFQMVYTLPKPIIAQVQGSALAGGCGLVSVCDFAFAVPTAKFGYTEVKIGFVPAVVMVFLLRKITEAKARELLMTGRLIDAGEAAGLGLITRVMDAAKLEEEVLSFTSRLITEASGQSVALVKRMLYEVSTMPLPEALDFAARENAKARMSEDYRTGISAFLGKKEIKW